MLWRARLWPSGEEHWDQQSLGVMALVSFLEQDVLLLLLCPSDGTIM